MFNINVDKAGDISPLRFFNPSNPASLSSSSLNLPARTSLIAPGAAPSNHSSRLKDRPSSSATSASASASSPSTRRSGTPIRRSQSKNFDDDNDPGRVRVSARVRPRNGEELKSDVDFADLVELQPEIKRLRLRKNNWSSESYRFDEVFTDTASQKRVYEGVAKPVVEVRKSLMHNLRDMERSRRRRPPRKIGIGGKEEQQVGEEDSWGWG